MHACRRLRSEPYNIACTGLEIAHQVADVAQHVYHSARTWGDAALGAPAPRPNLERLPMLARLGADGSAHFTGGRAVGQLDAVVYCTGYPQPISVVLARRGRVHAWGSKCLRSILDSVLAYPILTCHKLLTAGIDTDIPSWSIQGSSPQVTRQA